MVFAVVVMLAVGLTQTSFGDTAMQKAGLRGEPASYTSLAFANPQLLPEQLGSRPERVDISFVIRNSGVSTHDYHWSVLVTHGGTTRQTSAGNVRVPAGHQTSIARPTSISCVAGQLQITVSLTRPAEHIDALAACKPRKG